MIYLDPAIGRRRLGPPIEPRPRHSCPSMARICTRSHGWSSPPVHLYLRQTAPHAGSAWITCAMFVRHAAKEICGRRTRPIKLRSSRRKCRARVACRMARKKQNWPAGTRLDRKQYMKWILPAYEAVPCPRALLVDPALVQSIISLAMDSTSLATTQSDRWEAVGFHEGMSCASGVSSFTASCTPKLQQRKQRRISAVQS
jgi:hypothetical protein